MPRPPPRATLFPYTTLFRSGRPRRGGAAGRCDQYDARPDPAGVPGTLAVRAEGAAVRRGRVARAAHAAHRSEEHTSEVQSHVNLVCRLLLEKKKNTKNRSKC